MPCAYVLSKTIKMKTHADVYKFWLGLCEKLLILFVAAIVIPVVVGHLKFRLLIVVFALIALVGLGVVLSLLTRKLWEVEKQGEDEG